MFVYIIRRRDRTPFCFISSILSKLEVSRKRLYMDYIYPGCMSYLVKYVSWKYSSPNECDKILKIQKKQTEPTDYMVSPRIAETRIAERLNIRIAESRFMLNQLRVHGPKLWNSIDQRLIRDSKILHSFKKSYKKTIIAELYIGKRALFNKFISAIHTFLWFRSFRQIGFRQFTPAPIIWQIVVLIVGGKIW